MPLHLNMPDTSSSSGYILQLLDRVESLEKLFQRLDQQLNQLQSSCHTHPPNNSSFSHSCVHSVNIATQTDDMQDSNAIPMNLDTLLENICQSQNKDKDIAVLKYFINHNIVPESSEISNFQPSMRRYLWQISRFVVTDDIVYRRKMDNDRITETLQLVVPSILVSDVLHTFHPTIGHVSPQCTLEKASKHLFWPFMHRDITNFSTNCNICQNLNTSQSTSTMDDLQLPSFAIQKAVCAITELTKDFMNYAHPHLSSKHKSSRRKNNTQTRKKCQSSASRKHHQSQPQYQHPQTTPQDNISSQPRERNLSSPLMDLCDTSHSMDQPRQSSVDDSLYDPHPTEHCLQSPRSDYSRQFPPRIQFHDHHLQQQRDSHHHHSPYRNRQRHSPQRDQFSYSPRRRHHFTSPPRDQHSYSPPRRHHFTSPPRDQHSYSPPRRHHVTSSPRDHHYNPVNPRDYHSRYSPARDDRYSPYGEDLHLNY